MKFKAKAKDCQLSVKVKASFGEVIDDRELDRFRRVFLRGFLKPKMIKRNLVEYTGPVCISFYDRFKKPMTKREFLFVLEQLAVAVQKLRVNHFSINGLVMDMQHAYINEVTKEAQFIFIPTVSERRDKSLVDFFEAIAYSVKPADEQDTDFVSRFVYFFRAMQPFDVDKIEKFVAKEDKSVVSIDKASLMITRKEYKQAIEYLNSIQDTYEVDEEAAHSIAMEEARAYAFLENMDETINSLERARNIALKYDPPRMDMEAIYLLMNCYLNNDILDKVVECARELKKANGEDYYSLAAYYYEPFALKKLGKQEEAKKLFEEAVTYFRSASLKNPGNVDCYAFRILSLRELGNCEKALELADYLVAVKDDLAEAHTLRATILEDLGREEEAKAERAKAVSIGGYMADLPANKQ